MSTGCGVPMNATARVSPDQTQTTRLGAEAPGAGTPVTMSMLKPYIPSEEETWSTYSPDITDNINIGFMYRAVVELGGTALATTLLQPPREVGGVMLTDVVKVEVNGAVRLHFCIVGSCPCLCNEFSSLGGSNTVTRWYVWMVLSEIVEL